MNEKAPEKTPLPPAVREYFVNAGRKGGLRGSRADKSRAGKLGAAALRKKLIEEAKAQEAQGQDTEQSPQTSQPQEHTNPA